MIRRIGRISLLAFQVVWLLAILPGHQRGAITLPGSPGACSSHSSPQGDTRSCCASRQKPGEPGTPSKEQDRAAHCAFCHFAIRMVFLPPPDLSVAPAGLVDVLPPVAADSQQFSLFFPTHDARGPPAA